jgi:hypothetical protein
MKKTTLTYTLEEYIKHPLDISQLNDFNSTRVECSNYERKLNKQYFLLSIAFGTLISIVVSMRPGDSNYFLLFFVGLIFTFLLYVTTLFNLGVQSLKKHPMKLVVGDNDYIRGTVGSEFKEVEIDTSMLPETGLAREVANAIENSGRPFYSFEKDLIRSLIRL